LDKLVAFESMQWKANRSSGNYE